MILLRSSLRFLRSHAAYKCLYETKNQNQKFGLGRNFATKICQKPRQLGAYLTPGPKNATTKSRMSMATSMEKGIKAGRDWILSSSMVTIPTR